ncbi:hypothetical protein D9M72_547980 [compost metagenome]
MVAARTGGVDLDGDAVLGIDKIPIDAADFDDGTLQCCTAGLACELHADPVHLAVATIEDNAVVGGEEEGEGVGVQTCEQRAEREEDQKERVKEHQKRTERPKVFRSIKETV